MPSFSVAKTLKRPSPCVRYVTGQEEKYLRQQLTKLEDKLKSLEAMGLK